MTAKQYGYRTTDGLSVIRHDIVGLGRRWIIDSDRTDYYDCRSGGYRTRGEALDALALIRHLTAGAA
jgi:hypothetical protein